METPTVTMCSCGHPPTPQKPGSCGTGYGRLYIRTDADGSDVYETRCYACCAAHQRDRMAKGHPVTLYLVSRPNPSPATVGSDMRARAARHWFVTDWSGHLEFPCYPNVRRSPRGGGFGSQRTDAWFTGPDGYVWHAVNRGDMDIARCRRTRERANP